jgi:hypothetical protein
MLLGLPFGKAPASSKPQAQGVAPAGWTIMSKLSLLFLLVGLVFFNLFLGHRLPGAGARILAGAAVGALSGLLGGLLNRALTRRREVAEDPVPGFGEPAGGFPEDEPPPPSSRQGQRSRRGPSVALGALILLACAAAAGYLFLQYRPQGIDAEHGARADPSAWARAESKLEVTGTMSIRDGGYAAVVNGRVVKQGDVVEVNMGPQVFRWTMASVAPEGVTWEPVDVRAAR